MGYQIRYENPASIQLLNRHTSRRWVLAGMLLLLLLTTVFSLWPQLRQTVIYAVLPGDPAVTAAAISELTGDLRSGRNVSAELKDFCLDILEGSGFDTGR